MASYTRGKASRLLNGRNLKKWGITLERVKLLEDRNRVWQDCFMRTGYILGVTLRPHNHKSTSIWQKIYLWRSWRWWWLWQSGVRGDERGRGYSVGKRGHWTANGNLTFFLHHILNESLSYFYLRNAASKMVLGPGEITELITQ